MNKHTKMAFLLAPVLLIGGYVASDFYVEHEASQPKIINMTVQEHCDIKASSCILQSGEFLIGVSDKDGITKINATFPLDTATLFFVDNQDQSTAHALGMNHSAYYWQAETPLGKTIAQPGSSQKMRLIAKIKGGAYISEFVTITK